MPDIGLKPYRYSERTRRPMAWIFLAVGLGLLALTFVAPPPPILYLPLGLFIALTLHALVRNIESGMEITARHLSFQGRGFDRRISVIDIDHVEIGSNSDGPDHLRIRTRPLAPRAGLS